MPNKNKKLRPVSKFSAFWLNLAIGIGEGAITVIESKELQESIQLFIQPLRDTVTKLSDADPDNKAQMEQIWLDFVRSDAFSNMAEARVYELVSHIENEKAKDFTYKTVALALQVIKSLYDVDPNNVAQIREVLTGFLTEKDNIKSGLAFLIEDEAMLEQVSTVIDTFHDGLAMILSGAID